MNEVSEAIALKVLETVDQGLSYGRGINKPGEMCIEAAVCYAYGLPHNDNPPCVGSAVREFKIVLNDCFRWKSNAERAKGMRAIAIAQLGSVALDQREFHKNIANKTIRKIIPKLLRYLADNTSLIEVTSLHSLALLCEEHDNAAHAARRVYNNLFDNLRRLADPKWNNASCAGFAARAIRYAVSLDRGEAVARVATSAAIAAQSQEYLELAAEICLEALKEMKSPGCEFLYLLEEQ
jgi:hypothetical protein